MNDNTTMRLVMPEEIRYRRELWRLLEHIPDTNLGGGAEIGVAEGNFAEEILRWPVKLPFLYLVDRWRCVLELKGDSAREQIWHDKNRIKATTRTLIFQNRVRILHMESVPAATRVLDGSLSFVNIDCDHSYAGVTSDINAWWPKLKRNGVISFHDYENPSYGVKSAVNHFATVKQLPVYLLPEDKEEDAGAFLIKA